MLRAHPTKKGTGVTIYGDYEDLTNLYQLVHRIANTLDETNKNQWGEFQLLMNFAYEIRKGKEGSRLIKNLSIEGEKHKLYGFQLIWPDIIIFINTLRSNAGYTFTDKLDQSTLYLLEYIIENAAFDYDPISSSKVSILINGNVITKDKLVFQIYQHMHYTFISKKVGKKRFRELYNFMKKHTSPCMEEYESLMTNLETSAKNHKCNVVDIEIKGTGEEIEW